MKAMNLLHARGLTLLAPGGRALFADLTLSLDRGDRVALIGRNGVGKSSLLQVLAGTTAADGGEVVCRGRRLLVPQALPTQPDGCGSPGELRRTRLAQAFAANPDLLLLDEPTLDLDQPARAWLTGQLRHFRNALMVVSHDRGLLRAFGDFFVASESGCRHVSGSFDALLASLEQEQAALEVAYVSQLERVDAHEQRQFRVRQRRERKRNLGRIRELKRCSPRVLLNSKRSYAQVKQGKRNAIQQARIEATRAFATVARRALAVELPLSEVLPRLADTRARPVVRAQSLSAWHDERLLFEDVSLELGRQRLALVGPNGAGKTTLIELLAGERKPQHGRVSSDAERIGYVAQNAANWCLDDSVLSQVLSTSDTTPEVVASWMRAHRFPLALAQRPLRSLSPGERLRAALICMLQRTTAPELLILDEPTSHLDLLGHDSLVALLQRWNGGLLLASHDEEFLSSVGVSERWVLGGPLVVVTQPEPSVTPNATETCASRSMAWQRGRTQSTQA